MMIRPENAEQARLWNEEQGPFWVLHQERMDASLAPYTGALFAAAALSEGERVLDVGCGCGETSLEAGALVGPRGRVLGLDVSAPMIERARARAAEAGLDGVEFALGDAAAHGFGPPPFDVLLSRFGVMFFGDPDAAFRHLAGALRPGGRLAFLCWQEVARNPWILEVLKVIRAHLPPQPPQDPHAPGPFAFADPARLRAILEGAGFLEVAIAPFLATHPLGPPGASATEAAAFALTLGPAARLVAGADEALKARIAAALADVLEPHRRPDGIRLPSAVHIVTARL